MTVALLPGQMELIAPGEVSGLVFGRRMDGIPLAERISWGEVEITDQDRPVPREDGTMFSRDSLSGQSLALSLVVGTDRVGDLAAAWRSLRTRGSPRRTCTLRLAQEAHTRVVYGRPRRFTPVEKRGWREIGWTAAEATFVCEDARFHSDTKQVLSISAVSSGSAGGLSWPLSWPLSWTALPRARDATDNVGDAPAWPTITFHGPLTGTASNPVLVGVSTGQVVRLATTLGVGDQVSISTRPNERGAFDGDGGDAAGLLRGDVLADLALAPGQTTWDYEVDDASGTSRVEVAWRHAWWSL